MVSQDEKKINVKEDKVSVCHTIKKVDIEPEEIVIVNLFGGKKIAGVVDKIDKKKGYFWLRASKDKNSIKERFCFKIDEIIKTN